MPRHTFTLIKKHQILPSAYYFVFKTESKLDTFSPGQFFSLEIEPKTYRPYSTVEVSSKITPYFPELKELPDLEFGSYATFMISTKPGGAASKIFEKVEIQTSFQAIGPSGKFRVQESPLKKVFVATGTGLAPFVPMIKKITDQSPQTPISIYFGSWTSQESFVEQFFEIYSGNPNFKIYRVVENNQGITEENLLTGRVTDHIPKLEKDLQRTEFYLCGHPKMVEATQKMLFETGTPEENIFFEKFGK